MKPKLVEKKERIREKSKMVVEAQVADEEIKQLYSSILGLDVLLQKQRALDKIPRTWQVS